jgi:peptidoglycan/xylan/chitin deacetylase (PgdA/CDA1 family)
MRKRILTLIAACFYYSGLVSLARWKAQRAPQRLLILNYHRATGGDLRRHLLYLRRHYRLLPLEQALAALYAPSPAPRGADRRLPLVLTFDDGYQDNYTHALPLARELQVPLTLFLLPAYTDSGAPFWWLEGASLVQQAQVAEVCLEGQRYHLPADRQTLTQAIDARLRYASSVAQREAFLAEMRQALAVPAHRAHDDDGALPLTWTQVQEMAASGWVTFGAHTLHHPVLAYLDDPAEVAREVGESRRVLEQQLGHAVRTFAYPIGKPEHIGEVGLQAVKDAGYDWALTTLHGWNTRHVNPHALRRIEVDISQHWLVIAASAAGLWGMFSRLRWNPTIRKYVTKAPHR